MTDNERAIERLEAEARRRGTSYGKLVMTLTQDECREIIGDQLWQRRREKLLQSLRGRGKQAGAALSAEERGEIDRLCGHISYGQAVREYLLTSGESAAMIAKRNYISVRTLRRAVRKVIDGV